MISNAFKSAYMNEQSAINQVGTNVTNAIKGAGTLIAGIAGFTGALGDGAVAAAAKHNLAGQIGGIGGNIMLATIDEKKAVAQSQQIQNLAKLSEDELDARFEPIAKAVDPNSLEEQVVDTVWNKIQKERAKNLEKNLVNKLDLQRFASKKEQMDIINETNPMRDDYHTGIRNVNDIKTWDEAIEDEESFTYGDFSKEDAIRAKETGKITVYSSKPISAGGFVSTSKNMAQDYAGKGKVYEQIVNLEDVAWINGDEGQYTRKENK